MMEPKTSDNVDTSIPKYPKARAEIIKTGVTMPTKDIHRMEISVKIIENS